MLVHIGVGGTMSGGWVVEISVLSWAASRLKDDGGHMRGTGVFRLNVPTASVGRSEYGKKMNQKSCI